MSQIKQSVKVSTPLAKSNGQGFAALRTYTLVRYFTSVLAITFSMVVQAGEAMPRRNKCRSANPV
ncbi:conserved exported protein of unknown function [Xenorhabdus doucetiae]|uniref:Uncharacterized protein n=2 Tax=Xenorhabdus TaxID=626 RepID=A0A068QP88_9GAMM|nr:conserved exported protein of unknown function [Xenorhabdus doucetiae]CDL86451.1 conserved exported hypothetical protein [Xenorhabdus cabanillasii JM26]